MQFDIDVGLPNKWLNCYLGEAIDYGKTKKANMASLDENTWVLELEDIEKNTSKVLQMLTFKERQSKSAKNEFEKGDILYGKLRPYLNKVIIAIENGVCSSEIIPIKCDPSFIEPRFLFYWLKSFEFLSFVNEVSYGVNMPRLGTKDGKKAPFRLAPLSEQKRIVEKLDSLLAQVETIQQRLNNLPDIIKRFRQSVLAAAVSGKLTEQWRKENEIPKFDVNKEAALFKFQMNSRKKYIHIEQDMDYVFDIPNSWAFTAIGNLTAYQQGMQIAKSTRREIPSKNVLPILRTVNYENNFEKDVHYAVVESKSIVAEPEDIIISRTGTVGRVLTGFKGIMHNNSFRVNFSESCVLRKYLILFIQSPMCQRYIRDKSGRSSQPDLTHTAFSKCPFSLPSIKEQIEIVRLVEQYFALADTLEKHLADAKARVDNLTQSILAKAFRGELVPQDPNDEPADKLLERIKAARLEAEKLEKAAKKAAKVKR